jgi:hypothetical protein
MSQGQSPIHAVPVGDAQQPQMVYQTVDQNGNVVYMAANPSMMMAPQQAPQGTVMYAVQQPNGTIAYVQQPGLNPPAAVIVAPAAPPKVQDPQLVQFLKNIHGAYAVLLLVEGVIGSVLAHYGATIGVGVALPCFLGMFLAFLSLAGGSRFDNFLGGNMIQFVFAIISISCAAAALSQNFSLEACAVEIGSSNTYTTYGHDSFYQEAIDCSSGYIYSDRSCGCVNHAGTCLHFETGYTDCHELLLKAPALSLVVFLLAMAQMLSLFGLLFYLVVVVDRTKL